MMVKEQSKQSARQSSKNQSKNQSSKQSNKRSSTQEFDICWKASLEDYVTSVQWSDDGSFLAAGSASGEVLLWTRKRSVFLRSAASKQAIGTLGFSVDGQYLAAAGQQGLVFVWDLATLDLTQPKSAVPQADIPQSLIPQPILVLENSHCWIDCLAWHPTQSWLAFGAGAQVKVWDIPQETLLSEQSFVASSVLSLAWHPDGRRLAVSGHTGVKVWSVDNWQAMPVLIEVPGASLTVAWSADGRHLASGNLDRTLTIVNWENPPPWLMQGFPGKVRQVDWAPVSSGTSINEVPVVAAACAEGITIWRRQGKTWQSKVLKKHKDTVESIAFHPTQLLLASAARDGQLCLWKKAAALQQTLRAGEGGFSAIAWHPHGQYLAAGSDLGGLLIWTLSQRGSGFQNV